MRNAIYQNRLALDYLLAAAGGIFGKFNLTSCCVQRGDQEQADGDLVKQMMGLVHVPVQTWHGWDPNNLFGGWFSTFGVFKTLISVALLGTYLLLPCLLSLVRTITSLIGATVERKTTAKTLMQ
uniref:Uncharacterized protein n=1 Tax=Rousettus aegyptiacus TaxID=9407 RepID=A0A7J8GAJ5_ROUAE|nr:hypothetical protein HJG63_011682 [Rousettus aegyptiacus]